MSGRRWQSEHLWPRRPPTPGAARDRAVLRPTLSRLSSSLQRSKSPLEKAACARERVIKRSSWLAAV